MPRLAHKYFNCELCGKQTYNYSNKKVQHYCSVVCRRAYEARRTAASRLVASETNALRRIAGWRIRCFRPMCDTCGQTFRHLHGVQGTSGRCRPCADAKRAALSATLHRAARAKGKAVRRARMVSAHLIDPIVILERDHWHCKLCGIQTPRTKRGSYADDAPEVDHIVALCLGGKHEAANLQCACRACNIRKGMTELASLRASPCPIDVRPQLGERSTAGAAPCPAL